SGALGEVPRSLAARCVEWLDVSGRNLSNLDLSGVHFRGATLRGTILRRVTFRETTRTKSARPSDQPRQPIFRDADLRNADLSDAVGLEARDFAGADLQGARLPEGCLPAEALEMVAELSKNSVRVFASMLLACGFTGLTIGTTRDAALLTNNATSNLPIINADIPILGFYMVAPALLFGLYLYLHLYLLRLWEALAA